MTNHNVNHKTSELINSLKNKDKIKILFVCLGNICRSPAAEGVLRTIVAEGDTSKRFIIDSCGTGGWHVGDLPDKRMRVHAVRRGYCLEHVCRQVRVADFDDFDIIVGMDAQNVRTLKQLAPSVEASDKVVGMGEFLDPAMGFDHIPDPYYEGAEGFERVLDLLECGCNNMYDLLR